jgi:acetyl-CoA carboxylase biotin carboxylase subunit
MALFHRLFVANRGEVAARIARGADALGITPVFGVSEADRDAPYTRGRETVVLGPGRSTESYLDMSRVVQAARQTNCSALHPGWGFLSENPRFAALSEAHGVTFVGPPAHAMALMGKKTPAKHAMKRAGLTLIPGSDGVLDDVAHAERVAAEVGFPILLKAESGGGGRGMRIARSMAEVRRAYEDASGEAIAAFGDGRLYLEKLVEGGRHVEVQVLADHYGHAIHLGERDCTVQRNHQKLIEESASPVLDDAERQRVLVACVNATRAIGYVGAGTMEFLLDETGTLRFMEMNTRLQVEHCVSEMRTGIDLVVQQLRIAAHEPLAIRQEDVRFEGHVIECRINAEDPRAGFKPAPGRITKWSAPPPSADLRVETHVETGYVVPPHYDSLLCKLVVRGRDREEARTRMLKALDELVCEGVPTTVELHRAVLSSKDFRENRYTTRAIPGFTEAR